SEVPGAETAMDAELVYATDLFDGAFAGTFAERFVRVLHGVAAEPDLPIGDIALLDQQERVKVVWQWNATAYAVDPSATLVSLFEAQV
ncbi:hypothetical protein IU459_37930, partial [Nocardia amamiensis]